MKFLLILITILTLVFQFNKKIYANEYLYILNENAIEKLYQEALEELKTPEVIILKDLRGIILRLELEHPLKEYYELSLKTVTNLKKIEKFLAKNKNPVIIEVHTGKKKIHSYLKNWELATVISNKIESCFKKNIILKHKDNISSIGYGEFLPVNNTPNNGGTFINRIDIIILCNISGE